MAEMVIFIKDKMIWAIKNEHFVSIGLKIWKRLDMIEDTVSFKVDFNKPALLDMRCYEKNLW